MKVSKFYFFPILYLFSIYSFFIMPEWLPEESAGMIKLCFIAFAGLVNIVACKICCKPEYERILLRSAILVKYALIPIYIMGCVVILVLLLLTISPLPFMIFAGPTGAVVLSVIGWIIMALSAPYTISYLHSAKKAGRCHVVAVWLHTVLQFFYCLDVIDMIVLSIKGNVFRKLSIGLIVVIVLAALVGFCVIVGGIIKLVMG